MYTIHSMFGSCSRIPNSSGVWLGQQRRRLAESGPGSRLGDSGHRQQALLEQGLGAEGHPQSAQRCSLLSKGTRSRRPQGNERKRQVACGNAAGYRRISGSCYRGPRSVVMRTKLVSKEGRTFRFAMSGLRAASSTQTWECFLPGIDVRSIVFTDEKFFRLQDDRKKRVWLDCGTTKKVTLFMSHASLSVVAPTVRKAPLLRTSVAHFPFFREKRIVSECRCWSQCCAGDFGCTFHEADVNFESAHTQMCLIGNCSVILL